MMWGSDLFRIVYSRSVVSCCSANVTVIRAPPKGLSVIVISPRYCSIISIAMDNPKPCPGRKVSALVPRWKMTSLFQG